MTSLFLRALPALALAFALTSVGAVTAKADEAKRFITVSGQGESSVTPDIARISVGVRSEAKTAKQALADNTNGMNRVMDALKAEGIAPNNIQTSNFSVGPQYDWRPDGRGGNKQVLLGYQVLNTVTVTLEEMDRVGVILDVLIEAGANQAGGIAFDVSDSAAATDEARKAAFADARRRAGVYAMAAGVELGDLVSLQEGTAFTPQGPMMMESAMAARSAGPVPIAPGESTLSVTISAVWEIED